LVPQTLFSKKIFAWLNITNLQFTLKPDNLVNISIVSAWPQPLHGSGIIRQDNENGIFYDNCQISM
jgi:hypothetical protein